MQDVLTILIVEDNVGHQRLTEYILRHHNVSADFRVVHDGQEALEYLQRSGAYENPELSPRPDLILLDLNLPKRDGREVLKLIKEDRELKDIPIVIVSTSDRIEDVNFCYQTGAVAYISKSSGFDMLSSQLADVIRFAAGR